VLASLRGLHPRNTRRGESFHFAHQLHGETLREAIKRHEHYLALKLGIGKGSKVLDVGCGVGGPLREIAMFSGATVTGLNNNEYQVRLDTAKLIERCSEDVGGPSS
jgi:sterol 24-C-methyltransferase